MIRYLKELYQGIGFSYYIFWDSKARAVTRIITKRNQIPIFNIEYLDNEDDLPEVLKNVGYAGEGLNIVLFGHSTIQRLENIEVDDEGIPDWIITNKSRIIPTGLDEDELFLDYCTYELKEESYLAMGLAKKNTLSDIKDHFKGLNLRLNAIMPLIGFTLDIYGLDVVIDNKADFPIQIPGFKFSLTATEGGHILNSSPGETPDSFIEGSHQQLPKFDNRKERELYFHKSENDFFSKLYNSALVWIRPIILGIAAVVSVSVIFNLIITAFEIKGSENLQEFQFLKSNLETINNQIENIERKHQLIDKLEGHRSHLSAYLNLLAEEKPEKLWWRKLEYNLENGLTIEGFCVGDEETAVYRNRMAESGYFDHLELSRMEKYAVREESRIPSRYRDEIYRFKLEIKGI